MRKSFTKSRLLTGLATLVVAIGAMVALSATSADGLNVVNRSKCTSDEIIRCGVTSKQDLVNKYDQNHSDVKNIFARYDITRNDIAGNNVKMGVVHQNGDVVVDGKVVAKNAYSLSRVKFHNHSRHVVVNGVTLYEGPNMSIFVRSVDAFVYFRDGQFHRGVLVDCANPIVAEPVPQPVYSCDNLTAQKLDRNRFRFTSSATARHGAEIVSYNYNFGDGTVKRNAGRTIEHTYNTTTARTYNVTMTVNIRVNGKVQEVSGGNCKTTVKVDAVPPKPVYKCESLTAKKINRTTYDFTVRASATNAKIVSYNFDFGNGRKATTANTTVRHDFGNNPGSYTVTVTVNVDVDGKRVTTPVGNCKTTVKVEELKPVFKCESLSATKLSRTQFRFDAAATAENATIRSYTFNFGDGNSQTVDTSAKAASVTHTYSGEARSYTAQVTITMADGKTATGPACKTTVKVEEKKVPSISIEKTVNGKKHDKVAVGVEFTYEITVRNTGNVVLKDAVVTDNAPSEVTLISASEGDIDGNTWTHTIPELEVEGVKSYTIKAKYDKYAEGVHKNRVCVDTPTVPGEPDDCDDATTETDEPIEVCDLTDNTIKTIQRSEFDEATMTTDLSECDEMEVCIIKDKTIKTIHRNEFDESTMTTDLSKCDEELPPELPQTGIDTLIGGSLGLGSITAAGYYWVASRRNLVSVLLNK